MTDRDVNAEDVNPEDVTAEPVTVNQKPESTRPDRMRMLKADDYRLAKVVAAVAGLLGFVLAALTPILPIDQKTSELHWPQNNAITNVTAPMVAFVPTKMDASVPCALARDLPAEGGVLLSTVPRQGRQAAARAGCSSAPPTPRSA